MEGISEKSENILAVGLVAVGLYVVYKLVAGVEKVGGAAVDAASAVGSAVATAAKDTYVAAQDTVGAAVGDVAAALWKTWDWATNSAMVPTGNVIMPDGSVIPLAQLKVSFNNQYNAAQFNYGTQAFVIPQNPNGPSYDTNGNYHAVAWNTFAASLGS